MILQLGNCQISLITRIGKNSNDHFIGGLHHGRKDTFVL